MSYFSNFNRVSYDIFDDGSPQLITNIATYSKIGGKLLDDASFYSTYTIPDGYRPDNVSEDLYGTPEYYWTFFVINDHLKNYYSDWPRSSGDVREYTEAKFPNLALIGRDIFGDDNLAGKIKVGATVRGQISNARGTLVAKYPTNSYAVIERTSGTFRAVGEAIIDNLGNSLIGESIIPEADAPAYYKDAVTGKRTHFRTAGVVRVTHFDVEIEKNNENAIIRVIKPQFIARVAKEFRKSMKG